MKNYYKERCKKEPWFRNFYALRSRVIDKNDKYFKKGIKNYLILEDLKYLWFRDKAYLLKKPSIDRIDNNGHYTLKNCRFIELSENSRLGNIGNRNKRGKYKKKVGSSALKMRIWRERKYKKVKL